MAIHRIPKFFSDVKSVEWPCPTCGQKTLRILEDSFVCKETASTTKMLSDEWFDLEYVSSIFSCMSQCIRQECNEVVACSGRSGLEPDWDDHNGIQYKPWYEPLSFIPGLKLFTLPEKCPVKISAPLETSFTLSKLCPGAAANLIRISIEELLTAIDVPNKKGDRLHNRIKAIPDNYSRFQDLLMAIKFLGNAGSHSYEKVTTDDLDNSYEIMNFILSDLYSDNRKKVSELANNLDKNLILKNKNVDI